MAGITDLDHLIRSMEPVLQPNTYVFVSVPKLPPNNGLEPVMVFREAEGVTLILEQAAASSAGLEGVFASRMITLSVHSSLEAVGFLAAITAKLAKAGMGVNPVSAFHHDHLFVPADRAEEAMTLLRELAATR
ncbi:ACT domain-containing protein [Caulobacter segnis]|uniref:ACT domain-containing protein n=1 Tax=Caulobacter segnis TaxID=88688 RepID=UPI00240FF138|nr:ACT domain-containing protein [Caulobacter segnis]MDG2522377.1 ACT domain-containing protein [Caulobacter segnis]